MIPIHKWQYRYIEKCLYNYHKIKQSSSETEQLAVIAIDNALDYFSGMGHEIIMREFYFVVNEKRNGTSFKWLACDRLYTETQNAYKMRREVVTKVAINFYALDIFKLDCKTY